MLGLAIDFPTPATLSEETYDSASFTGSHFKTTVLIPFLSVVRLVGDRGRAAF